MKIFASLLLLAELALMTKEGDAGLADPVSGTQAPQDPSVDKTLRFRPNHQFVILQLTDLHYGDDEESDAKTTGVQEALIATVKPDLVIITGDAVSGYMWDKHGKGFFKTQWEKFTAPYRTLKQRYAYVFGNHEIEADLSPQEIGELDRTHPYSLFNGSKEADKLGYSNYILEVKSAFEGQEDKTAALLWMFDTRKTGCEEAEKTYGCIDKAQISWYKRESQVYVNPDKTQISGLGFFHIPLPEFMYLWNRHLTYGSKNETVGCPTVDSGAFGGFTEVRNIKGLFCGHDHTNDYGGSYQGIELVYGRKTGYGSYGPESLKGGRVIVLTENLDAVKGNLGFDFKSYIVQEDKSSVIQEPPHWQGFEQYQKICKAHILALVSLFLVIVSNF